MILPEMGVCLSCVCVCMHLTLLPRDQIKMGQIFFLHHHFLSNPYTKDLALWGPSFGQRASHWIPFLGFVS